MLNKRFGLNRYSFSIIDAWLVVVTKFWRRCGGLVDIYYSSSYVASTWALWFVWSKLFCILRLWVFLAVCRLLNLWFAVIGLLFAIAPEKALVARRFCMADCFRYRMDEETLWVPVSASLVTPPWSEFFFELTFKLSSVSVWFAES